MKNQPKVSILIPVFNGSEYIEETVSSVQNSKYGNFEIILVDDGSTDISKIVCHKLDEKYPNVRFYSFPKNGGMTRSLNFGIAKSTGKYIVRINQDDLMVADRVVKQVKFLEENPDYVAVGGYVKLFTSDNPEYDFIKFPLTDSAIRKTWMYLSPYADPAVTFRKSAYLKTDGYSQDMWPADDVHMWYQLGKVGKLANLPNVMTNVRWHKNAGSIKFHKIQMKKTYEVHKWASINVSNPTFFERLFWMGEYLAGNIFPAKFNWAIYRLIRKLMSAKKVVTLKFKLVPASLSYN